MIKRFHRRSIALLAAIVALWALMASSLWASPARPDLPHPSEPMVMMGDCDDHQAADSGKHCDGEHCQCFSHCQLPGATPVAALDSVAVQIAQAFSAPVYPRPLEGVRSPPYRPPSA